MEFKSAFQIDVHYSNRKSYFLDCEIMHRMNSLIWTAKWAAVESRRQQRSSSAYKRTRPFSFCRQERGQYCLYGRLSYVINALCKITRNSPCRNMYIAIRAVRNFMRFPQFRQAGSRSRRAFDKSVSWGYDIRRLRRGNNFRLL